MLTLNRSTQSIKLCCFTLPTMLYFLEQRWSSVIQIIQDSQFKKIAKIISNFLFRMSISSHGSKAPGEAFLSSGHVWRLPGKGLEPLRLLNRSQRPLQGSSAVLRGTNTAKERCHCAPCTWRCHWGLGRAYLQIRGMLELAAQAGATLLRFAKAGCSLGASTPPSQSHTSELPICLPGAGTPAALSPSLWQAQGDQRVSSSTTHWIEEATSPFPATQTAGPRTVPNFDSLLYF